MTPNDSRIFLRGDNGWLVSLSAVSLLLVLSAASATAKEAREDESRESARLERVDDDHNNPQETSPEETWERFVAYLDSNGHEDVAASLKKDGKASLPDLSRGDPIRGVLFRLSKDLINLDALFTGEESPGDAAARSSRIESLVERLKDQPNPYLRDYALYYEARHLLRNDGNDTDVEVGQEKALREAAIALGEIAESPRFLGRQESRRHLAEVYRRLGEDTLAVLELRFYIVGLGPDDGTERAWAEDQLKEIREHHEGPLHDCVDRVQSISLQIARDEVGEETQAEQRQVEAILEKVAKLLEDMAGRCPECNKKLGNKKPSCKTCEKQGKKCKACKAAKGCKACAGSAPGSGPGDPTGNKPSDTAAQDTKIRSGDPGKANLRANDSNDSKPEPWGGGINDREVARSLREAWSRIPPSYRALVARYFKDITDLEPDSKEEEAK